MGVCLGHYGNIIIFIINFRIMIIKVIIVLKLMARLSPYSVVCYERPACRFYSAYNMYVHTKDVQVICVDELWLGWGSCLL